MYLRGSRVSPDKASPAGIHEELQHKYPESYSLAGENEIRQEISRLFSNEKKN